MLVKMVKYIVFYVYHRSYQLRSPVIIRYSMKRVKNHLLFEGEEVLFSVNAGLRAKLPKLLPTLVLHLHDRTMARAA